MNILLWFFIYFLEKRCGLVKLFSLFISLRLTIYPTCIYSTYSIRFFNRIFSIRNDSSLCHLIIKAILIKTSFFQISLAMRILFLVVWREFVVMTQFVEIGEFVSVGLQHFEFTNIFIKALNALVQRFFLFFRDNLRIWPSTYSCCLKAFQVKGFFLR